MTPATVFGVGLIPPHALPLPPWARIVVWLGSQAALDAFAGLFDGASEHDASTMPAWRRLSVRWARPAPSGLREDIAQCSFDLLKSDSENLRGDWDASDFTDAETRFDTFFTAINSLTPASHRRVEYRWHFMQFRPLTDAKPFTESGPAVRVTPRNVLGAHTAASAYQVAMAVTELTGRRANWGRFYLPITNGALDASSAFNPLSSRWIPSNITTVANAVETLYEGLVADGLSPVVPATSMGGSPVRALLGVRAIQIDDIPDIIRRRRPKQAAIRTVRDATT